MSKIQLRLVCVSNDVTCVLPKWEWFAMKAYLDTLPSSIFKDQVMRSLFSDCHDYSLTKNEYLHVAGKIYVALSANNASVHIKTAASAVLALDVYDQTRSKKGHWFHFGLPSSWLALGLTIGAQIFTYYFVNFVESKIESFYPDFDNYDMNLSDYFYDTASLVGVPNRMYNAVRLNTKMALFVYDLDNQGYLSEKHFSRVRMHFDTELFLRKPESDFEESLWNDLYYSIENSPDQPYDDLFDVYGNSKNQMDKEIKYFVAKMNKRNMAMGGSLDTKYQFFIKKIIGLFANQETFDNDLIEGAVGMMSRIVTESLNEVARTANEGSKLFFGSFLYAVASFYLFSSSLIKAYKENNIVPVIRNIRHLLIFVDSAFRLMVIYNTDPSGSLEYGITLRKQRALLGVHTTTFFAESFLLIYTGIETEGEVKTIQTYYVVDSLLLFLQRKDINGFYGLLQQQGQWVSIFAFYRANRKIYGILTNDHI